ncbi:MAG: cyclic pyranopterin monophosphate synthase MoaC, partial [Hyphomicrobiales bacterium]
MSKNLTHINADGAANMVDVSDKDHTTRLAIASSAVKMQPATLELIVSGNAKKGDVIGTARLAGIMAAKKTHDLIPLCHPLPLDHVAIRLVLEPKTHSVLVYAFVGCFAKTGVEMEALSAVNAALLTLYDLTKPVEPALTICDISLLLKEGGKKGRWIRPEGLPDEVANFAAQPA